MTARVAAFDLDSLVPAGEIPNVRANGAAVGAKSGHGFARVEQNLDTTAGAKTLTPDAKTRHVLTIAAEFGPLPAAPPRRQAGAASQVPGTRSDVTRFVLDSGRREVMRESRDHLRRRTYGDPGTTERTSRE